MDCPVCWGTHGCDLPKGHAGEHQCIRDHNPDEGDITPEHQPWAKPFCFNCLRGHKIDERPCDMCEGIRL